MPRESVGAIALGRAMRKLRKESGLTQEALSSRAAVHVTFVSGIERGKSNPSFASLERLLIAMDVNWCRFAEELEKENDL